MGTKGQRFVVAFVAATALVGACAPAGPASGPAGREETRAVAPKRITVAVSGDPVSVLYRSQNAMASQTPGVDALQELVHAGLAHVDNGGVLQAQLAAEVPTAANGGWRVESDGRMEITWHIKDGARWHDGEPLTAADLLFTARLGQDSNIAAFGHAGYAALDRIEVRDPRTVVISWKHPFLQADNLFTLANSGDFGTILPRHLLERAYEEDPSALFQLPFWNEAFVGAGPYRVQSWERGSHLVLSAFDGYVLGRPKIDQVIVRIIPDQNAMVANLLAGEVQLTIGKTLSFEQALRAGPQWTAGRVETSLSNWLVIYPQFLNPSPAIVGNPLFRKALAHAANREELVATLMSGATIVADTFTNPQEPEWGPIQDALVRYSYDVARAASLLEGAGLVRGPDGFYRLGTGQPLEVELRTDGGNDLFEKTLLGVADSWERAGVRVQRTLVPLQRKDDREYAATFPGFALTRNPSDFQSLIGYRGSNAQLPENSFRSPAGGVNRSRYTDGQFDALIDRYQITIPWEARMQLARDVVHSMSDQVTAIGLFYDVEPTFIASALQNVTARTKRSVQTWNAQEWDRS